jgi:hypothetical protein
MFVTVKQLTGVFIIWVHAKLCMPGSNDSLLIAIKPKDNYRFRPAIMLSHILENMILFYTFLRHITTHNVTTDAAFHCGSVTATSEAQSIVTLFFLVGYLTIVWVARLCSVEWYHDRWMMNWKGFGRKRSWPNQDTIPAFAWKNWGKSQKPQDIWCPGLNSNQASSEYGPGVLQLWHPFCVMFISSMVGS